MTEWEGDILSYKDHLKAKVMKESNKDAKSKFIKFLLKINVFYVTVIIFKETVLVFSSDLPCKDGNARFTTVLLNPLSDHTCGRYPRFSTLFIVVIFSIAFK